MIQKPVSLIAGSTGLMGSLIIENLTSLSGSVISLTRNSNNLSKDVIEKIINFDDLLKNSIEINESIDHVYLTLGKKLSTYELAYMPEANRESFKKIDYDYSLAIAELGFKKGAKSIALVSAIGAEENSLKRIGYENICIAQPGHLLGKRKDFRGYEIPFLEGALHLASPFMQGPLKDFRQIEASKVADQMVKVTREEEGLSILTYDDFT